MIVQVVGARHIMATPTLTDFSLEHLFFVKVASITEEKIYLFIKWKTINFFLFELGTTIVFAFCFIWHEMLVNEN